MKFEIKVDVPEPTAEATRYIVTCGQRSMVIKRTDDGLWLPEFDWRQQYTLIDEERRGHRLPFDKMLEIAKKEMIISETRRQILAGARKVKV